MSENLEQLSAQSADVNEQIAEEAGQEKEAESSMFGKFKDATSLADAYSSLEKEFTRKSQKYASLKKAYDEVVAQKTQNKENKVQNQSQNEENSEIFDKQENKESLDQYQPYYLKSDWRARVREFTKRTPEAQEYASDIAKILMKDKRLATSDNCLDYAFAIAKNNRSASTNYANITEDIKNSIINEYLSSINQGKSNLKLISGEASSSIATPTQDKPKSIKEASLILKKLLQK